MKRAITIIISLLLVCLLIAGCTPKNGDSKESGTLPELTEQGLRPSPEGTVAPTERESTDDGLSAPDQTPAGEQAEDEDEGGLEVVDDYTIDVGDDVVVGGD